MLLELIPHLFYLLFNGGAEVLPHLSVLPDCERALFTLQMLFEMASILLLPDGVKAPPAVRPPLPETNPCLLMQARSSLLRYSYSSKRREYTSSPVYIWIVCNNEALTFDTQHPTVKCLKSIFWAHQRAGYQNAFNDVLFGDLWWVVKKLWGIRCTYILADLIPIHSSLRVHRSRVI